MALSLTGKLLGKENNRLSDIVCSVKGCKNYTYNKPHCTEHIGKAPYISALLKEERKREAAQKNPRAPIPSSYIEEAVDVIETHLLPGFAMSYVRFRELLELGEKQEHLARRIANALVRRKVVAWTLTPTRLKEALVRL